MQLTGKNIVGGSLIASGTDSQNFPDSVRPPPELKDRNERDIWRLVDGEWTKDDV